MTNRNLSVEIQDTSPFFETRVDKGPLSTYITVALCALLSTTKKWSLKNARPLIINDAS